MSTKNKGRRTISKAKEYLLKEKYLVDEVELGGKFRNSRDLFAGVCTKCWKTECVHEESNRFEGFDLIALSENKVVFIQVKTNKPARQHNYKKFARKFVTKDLKVWCMTWYDRKGWVIQKYNKNGTITKKDLRG